MVLTIAFKKWKSSVLNLSYQTYFLSKDGLVPYLALIFNQKPMFQK